jgi:hypothetical protein
MRAFRVFFNKKRLCTAGIGNDGVLSVTVTHVPIRRSHDIRLYVGGLRLPENEHVRWKQRGLRVGDEVLIKVVETASVDVPRKRFRRDSGAEEKAEKRQVEAKAKKFGWKVVKPRKAT